MQATRKRQMLFLFFHADGVTCKHYANIGVKLNGNYLVKVLANFLPVFMRKHAEKSANNWHLHWDNSPLNTAPFLVSRSISTLEHHNVGAPAVQSRSGVLWLFSLLDLKIRACWHHPCQIGSRYKVYCHSEVCCGIQEVARAPWKMCTAQGRLFGKKWQIFFCWTQASYLKIIIHFYAVIHPILSARSCFSRLLFLVLLSTSEGNRRVWKKECLLRGLK